MYVFGSYQLYGFIDADSLNLFYSINDTIFQETDAALAHKEIHQRDP